MKDRDIYSILIPFVENYFHGEDYSLKKFTPVKAKEIIKNSIVYIEYDSKRKILYIINTQNDEEYITIDLRNKQIDGYIEYNFFPDSEINYFDNVGDYIFNSELIKNVLEYTSIGIKGKIKNINKYCIFIGEEDTYSSDVLQKPIFSLFKNEIEFSTLYNISKNSTITSEDRFVWIFNCASNLTKVSKRQFKFNFVVKGLKLNDEIVTQIRKLNNSNINSVEFLNCKFKLQNEDNIAFIKSISAQ